MRTIPLDSGLAHFSFRVEIGGTRLRFRMDWLTRYEYYNVTVYDSQGNRLIGGRGLHPDIDLLQGLNLGAGKAYLTGNPATPENLTVENRFVVEDD